MKVNIFDHIPKLLFFYERAFRTGLFIALLVNALFFIAWSQQRMNRVYENALPESSIVANALLVAQGNPIYSNPDTWPYQTSAYGPAHFYIMSAPLRFIGLSESRWENAWFLYRTGRWMSLISTCLICVWLWFTARNRLHWSRFWSTMPLLLFFCSLSIIRFTYAARPDMPAVAFALWGWYAAGTKKRHSELLAALLMVTGLYCKPTIVASAAGLFIALIAMKQYRKAGCYVIYGIILSLFFYSFTAIENGMDWFLISRKAMSAPVYLPATYEYLMNLGAFQTFPLWGSLIGIIIAFRITGYWTYILTGAGVSFLAATLFLTHAGSDTPYYVESYCWGTLLTSLSLRWVSSRILKAVHFTKHYKNSIRWKLACQVLLSLTLTFFIAAMCAKKIVNLASDRHTIRPATTWPVEHPETIAYLSKIEGRVLLSEAFPFWFVNNEETIRNPMLYSNRVLTGSLSPSEVISMIKRKEIDKIILQWKLGTPPISYAGVDMLPEQLNESIENHYELEHYSTPYYFYAPKE